MLAEQTLLSDIGFLQNAYQVSVVNCRIWNNFCGCKIEIRRFYHMKFILAYVVDKILGNLSSLLCI